MKKKRLFAALVGLVTVNMFAANASAVYHPSTGRFLQRDPETGGAMSIGVRGAAPVEQFVQRDTVAPTPTPSPMMGMSMPDRAPAPMGASLAGLPLRGPGGPDMPRVGVSVYPGALASMPPINQNPEDPPDLFDPTGRHPDGLNLYQYVRGSPVRWRDPQGTNIYLKRGNNTGNPVNDAIHESVCVDTGDGKKGENLVCFSFGMYGIGWVPPGKWLGWWLPPKPQFGFGMMGKIYDAPNVGTVVKQKVTTCEQDTKWLIWMVDYRLAAR